MHTRTNDDDGDNGDTRETLMFQIPRNKVQIPKKTYLTKTSRKYRIEIIRFYVVTFVTACIRHYHTQIKKEIGILKIHNVSSLFPPYNAAFQK